MKRWNEWDLVTKGGLVLWVVSFVRPHMILYTKSWRKTIERKAGEEETREGILCSRNSCCHSYDQRWCCSLRMNSLP